MNCIGIDLGQANAVVCLCEGDDWRARHSWRNLGDGKRSPLMPIAADAEGRWASAAVDAASGTLSAGFVSPNVNGWIEQSVVETFLAGLSAEAVLFLGRVKPVRRNGFEVVIAPHSTSFAGAQRLVLDACQKSPHPPFEDALCLPPEHALLCRWAMERPPDGSAAVNAIVICVGDTQSSVAAYAVNFDENQAHAAAGSLLGVLPGHGCHQWEEAMVRKVADRARTDLTPAMWVDILDGVRSVATVMRRTAPDAPVALRHRLLERMWEKMEFFRGELTASVEVNDVMQPLSDLVGQAFRMIDQNSRTEIIIGGVGAYWPFVMDYFTPLFGRQAARLWHSEDPRQDVARGAALWPRFTAAPNVCLNSPDGLTNPAEPSLPRPADSGTETLQQLPAASSPAEWMQRPPIA